MYHTEVTEQPKETLVTVEEIKADLEPAVHESSQPKSWVRASRDHIRKWLSRYFPWIGEAPPEHIEELHKRKSFPWLGLSCILLSLSTIFLTLAIFKCINGRKEFTSKYVKPASWLSVIVSVNSIALHIALNEGVTTAWWYRASRSDVTMQDLHETYIMGTSTVAVLLAGKKFNYVAMATIFVATIPLNGFLLQNTVDLVPQSVTNLTTLYLPIVSRLPLGFSADAINGQPSSWSNGLSSAASSLEGLTTLPAGVTYVVGQGDAARSNLDWYGCKNRDDSAVCVGNATLAGFIMDCNTTFNETYDLRPSQNPNGITARVFSSNVTWNPAQPDIINLEVLYKPNQTCQGFYERKICQMQVANMKMPLQIQGDQGYVPATADDTPSAVISLADYVGPSDLTFAGELAPYQAEGAENSTYGGIAQWLSDRYGGSIDWTYANGSWRTNSSGTIARLYQFNTVIYPQDPKTGQPQMYNTTDGNYTFLGESFTPAANNVSWCNNTYDGLDWMTDAGDGDTYSFDPADTIYMAANSLMVLASANLAVTQWTNNDTMWNDLDNSSYTSDEFMERWTKDQYPSVTANQTQVVPLYSIRYVYWGASVAVNVSIALMILPLFYGFWWLERRSTLSPFETAVAFRAPGLEGVDLKKDADALLKEIGNRPVHVHHAGSETSLPSSAPPTLNTRSQSVPK